MCSYHAASELSGDKAATGTGPCSLSKVFSFERVTSITEKIGQISESFTWAQGVAECVGT